MIVTVKSHSIVIPSLCVPLMDHGTEINAHFSFHIKLKAKDWKNCNGELQSMIVLEK